MTILFKAISLLAFLFLPPGIVAQTEDSDDEFGGPSGVTGELYEAREIQ